MKSTFKDWMLAIFGFLGSAAFFVGVFAFLLWGVNIGGLFHWLHEVFSILWCVAGFASIVFGAMAFTIQRDRRAEKSIDARFEDESSEAYDAMEKDPAWARTYEHWRDVHVERHRTALRGSEARRWEDACRFWMLAAGCAIASLLMLVVTALRCIRA